MARMARRDRSTGAPKPSLLCGPRSLLRLSDHGWQSRGGTGYRNAMEMGRILIIGQEKDSAYAIRNVFELERYELELALQIDVAKSILTTRHIDLIVLDPHISCDENFDIIDFQLDHGLEIPIVVVGGELVGAKRKVRTRRGIQVYTVQADGYKLLDFVRAFAPAVPT